MKRSRPKSILWFERLFIGSFIMALADIFYHDDLVLQEFQANGTLSLEDGIIYAGILFIGLGIQAIFWFFIAYRASNIARWIYAVLWSLGILVTVVELPSYSGSEIAFGVVSNAMALGSVVALFTADARSWFQFKGRLPGGVEQDLSEVFK